MAGTTRHALAEIADDAVITDELVSGLRQAVYADGKIDAREARHLLQLHRTRPVRAAAWPEFFVEAIADYYALQREAPEAAAEAAPNYLRAAATALKIATLRPGQALRGLETVKEAAQFLTSDDVASLVTAFKAEGDAVLDLTERRLLARLFDRCVELPEALRQYALDAVYATVMADGRVTEDEVGLLRRVLWGPASEEGVGISRREAEVLFAIANKTARAENAPEWRDVFVKGVASYLLYAGETPEQVDAGEAAWLAAKLGRPGALDALRRDLMAYLKREARYLDPRLEEFDAA